MTVTVRALLKALPLVAIGTAETAFEEKGGSRSDQIFSTVGFGIVLGTKLCTDLFGATAPVVVPNRVGRLLFIMSKAAARKLDFYGVVF